MSCGLLSLIGIDVSRILSVRENQKSFHELRANIEEEDLGKNAIIGANAVGTNDNGEIGSIVHPAHWNLLNNIAETKNSSAQLELSLRNK